MPYFPMFIDLTNKKVLIVGGGHTALRKAEKLIPFGCDIFFISEKYNNETKDFIERHHLQSLTRAVCETDLTHQYAMVIMATDDAPLNKRYCALCQKIHLPINSVDEPSHCSFIFPALYVNENLAAGITSGGKGPLISSYIRRFLETQLPKNLGAINEIMGDIRPYIKSHYEPAKRKDKIETVFHWLMDNPQLSKETIIKQLEGGVSDE